MNESPGIAALAASVRSPKPSPRVVIGGSDLVQSILAEAHEVMEWVHARIQVVPPTHDLRRHWPDYRTAFKLFYYRNWHPIWREPHALQTARLWLAKAKQWFMMLDKLLHKNPYDDFPMLPVLSFAVSLGSLVVAIAATTRKCRGNR